MKVEFEMGENEFTELYQLLKRLPKVCSDEQLCNLFGCMSGKQKAEYAKEGELEYHTKSYAGNIKVQLKAMVKALKPAYLDYLQHMHTHLEDE